MVAVTVAAAMAGAIATAFLLARRTARIEVAAILRGPTAHQAGVSTTAVAG
jgi:hypothetical protein